MRRQQGKRVKAGMDNGRRRGRIIPAALPLNGWGKGMSNDQTTAKARMGGLEGGQLDAVAGGFGNVWVEQLFQERERGPIYRGPFERLAAAEMGLPPGRPNGW